MTPATTRQFITAIARAMYAVKKYPTSLEFESVGWLVVERYPFLKSPIGNGYGHIVARLKERFKNYRRSQTSPLTNSVEQPSQPKRKKLKTASSLVAPLPEVAEGEDKFSYMRHIKSIKTEWGKRKPNTEFIHQLMRITYPQRRKQILEQPHTASDILLDFHV
jgi:hypothetical protein